MKTKEARMDVDRKTPVQGADESRLQQQIQDGKWGSLTSNQDLVLLSHTPTTTIHNPPQRDYKGIRKFIL